MDVPVKPLESKVDRRKSTGPIDNITANGVRTGGSMDSFASKNKIVMGVQDGSPPM